MRKRRDLPSKRTPFVSFSLTSIVQAFSSVDWRRFRLVRVMGLCPLLLLPLYGFAVFMAQSNWLSVVYMGACVHACHRPSRRETQRGGEKLGWLC